MKTTTLHSGDTRLDVSTLCLGVMNLGVREDASISFAVMDRFYEAGGRFFDTANNYGSWGEDSSAEGGSERVLGRWIAERGVSDEVVVATKCGAGRLDPTRPLGGDPPTNFEGLSPETVRTQLTGSLARLGLDRVGVYYGHVDDRLRSAAEIADTFAALVTEGLLAIPGISNCATWRLAEARLHSRERGRPEFGVWQQQHSVYWPAAGADVSGYVDRDAIDYAAENPDLIITTYSPQQAGQLVRPWLPFRDAYDHPDSYRRLRLTHRIAHELGATANQVALAWHLVGSRSNVRRPAGSDTKSSAELPVQRATMLPIIGASSVAQLDEALGALDVRLDADQLAELDGA